MDGTVSRLLTAVGDKDAVIRAESDRWDSLAEDGLALDWRLNDYTELWDLQYGEQSVQLRLTLSDIATEASRAAFDEFDEPPHIVDAYPDEQSAHPIGWYSLLHQVTLQQGYSFEEELKAYLQGIKGALDNLATYEDSDDMNDRIDEIIATVEAKRPEHPEK